MHIILRRCDLCFPANINCSQFDETSSPREGSNTKTGAFVTSVRKVNRFKILLQFLRLIQNSQAKHMALK